jgi:hypothetical protein
MRAAWVVGLVGAAFLTVPGASGVPRPEEKGKSYVFPAGRYVLAGGPEAAAGDDVTELMDDFRMKPGQFILSGGPSPTDEIVVDDDLELLQDGKSIFLDNDGVDSTNKDGKHPATYQGHPIVFNADSKGKLRVRATDQCRTQAILGELWLHRADGARRRLSEKIQQRSAAQLPHVFFDEEFDLAKGFDIPAAPRKAREAVIDLPERPAMLLPKNKANK